MFKPYSYIAIDPGHTSGWATWDHEGNLQQFGQFNLQELGKLNELIHDNLKHIIVEDYRNHGWTQQKRWSRNETSKIIGRIEALAELRGVSLSLQANTVKSIGYKWAGLGEAPSNHAISHQFDAVAHGTYWLQTNGIIPPGKAIPE